MHGSEFLNVTFYIEIHLNSSAFVTKGCLKYQHCQRMFILVIVSIRSELITN